jgi:hypothetical protein
MDGNISGAAVMESNHPIALQGFPAFYSSLAPECHISSFSTKYDRFSEPDISNPVVQLGQALLRAILLQATASEGTVSNCTNGNSANFLLRMFNINEIMLNIMYTYMSSLLLCFDSYTYVFVV